MRQYKCIFFDLDHTLWDYETNSFDTLQELYNTYNLQVCGVRDCESFQRQFRNVNLELWDLYDRALIDQQVIRNERFKRILAHFGIVDGNLCELLSEEYLKICPKKGNLMPHALETLQYLSKHYRMAVVTNGFEEIQNVKLASADLHRFFPHVITSQKAGCRKPSQGIFDYAIKVSEVSSGEVIMIGDNLLTDIGGAKNASIDAVFFNPEKIVHDIHVNYEITSLAELQNIL